VTREVVLDTETTGLDPADGHRIVEIAAVELINHLPTGRSFHRLVNPQRDVPADALAVHGLTEEMLAKEPVFAAVAEDFLAFIGNAALVIHNAEFDIKFVNAELQRLERPPLAGPVIDTVQMARRRFPNASASLDALCRRYEIDLSARDKHSAKLDCELLAAVYLELLGGRQTGLDFIVADGAAMPLAAAPRPYREPRVFPPSEDELAAHAALLARLKEPIWLTAG
jgi:DNA polymerase III subunit epsilon